MCAWPQRDAHAFFVDETDLLTTAARSGQPTQDPRSLYFGMPHNDFIDRLRDLRDEVEQRAYLAIVAEAEGILQADFRARATGGARVPLYTEARSLVGRPPNVKRVDLDDILDSWRAIPSIRKTPISEFKQLLLARHWLAHGRHFAQPSAVPLDPGFAYQRTQALRAELVRRDPAFPR